MASVPALDNFRLNLVAVCDVNGITQRELSRRSGISFVYINRIFAGTVEPSVPVCEKLAKAVGLSVPAIFSEPASEKV